MVVPCDDGGGGHLNTQQRRAGRSHLKIHLRPIDYTDPKKIVEKIPDGYNWAMDRRVYLKSADDLDYVFGLVEQSYKNVIQIRPSVLGSNRVWLRDYFNAGRNRRLRQSAVLVKALGITGDSMS